MNSALRNIRTIALIVIAIPALAQAAFSPPPNWSPMTMLNVTFSTTALRLSVVDQATLMGPGVYAVMAIDTYNDPLVTTGATSYGRPNNSATAYGSFDPVQPWGLLNNTAFSRRLGWNPGGGTLQADIQATYGAGASIWIECLSKTPGLESYLAVGKWGVKATGTNPAEVTLDANNVPLIDPAVNGYSGIFGTGASSTKWKWDYLMDHNVYVVSSANITVANQVFTADYKVYIGDASGNEILNTDTSSASTIETWTWQGPAIPEPATLALLVGGAAMATFRRRRR
ncbi:MAG: PEP-CTERM sorting domain-containing protein [Phycisphaerae bacterium]